MDNNPLDRVFNSHDTDLHTKGEPNSGVVTLVIPGVGELRMSLAKAEDIAASMERQAEYGRKAAEPKKDRMLFHISRRDNSDDTTLVAAHREDAKRQARTILGGDPEWYVVEPIKTEAEHLEQVEKDLERARQSRKDFGERREAY